MGRGDKRSKRGKIFMGSFGNSRPKNKKIVKARREKAIQDSKKGK